MKQDHLQTSGPSPNQQTGYASSATEEYLQEQQEPEKVVEEFYDLRHKPQQHQDGKSSKSFKKLLLTLSLSFVILCAVFYFFWVGAQGPKSSTMAIILNNVHSEQQLSLTLDSIYWQLPSNEVESIVALVSNFPSLDLIKKYRNVFWVQKDKGEFIGLELMVSTLKSVKSSYLLYIDDSWILKGVKFVQQAKALLNKKRNLISVFLDANATKKLNQSENDLFAGFIFEPSVVDTQKFKTIYQSIKSQQKLTREALQKTISQLLSNNRLLSAALTEVYISKIELKDDTKVNKVEKFAPEKLQITQQQQQKYKAQKAREKYEQVKKQRLKKKNQEYSKLQQEQTNANIPPISNDLKSYKLKEVTVGIKALPKIQSIVKSPSQYSQIVKKYETQKRQYEIKVDFSQEAVPKIINSNLSWYGIDKSIQIGSNYDYLNISSKPQFRSLDKWLDSLPYQVYNFTYNQSLEHKSPQMVPLKNITTYEQANRFISSYQKYSGYALPTKIAAMLVDHPDDQILQQAEYLYFEQKHRISSYGKQLPMCIFASGYNVVSKLRYDEFFASIERQNYTNYRLIIVDDNSTDDSVSYMYNYLKNTNFRLKNRITIVRNLVRLGSVGNLFIRIKQFCKQGEIVVNVDSDDKLIGRQTLKILNSYYHDPNAWVVYSYYIQKKADLRYIEGASQRLRLPSSQVRNTVGYWATSHLKTFRRDVHFKVPVEYFLQYHYNQEEKLLQPRFYDGASDRFLIYSVIQLAGSDRIRFVPQVLMFYYHYIPKPGPSQCYVEHIYFDELKARLKTPLQALTSLSDVARRTENYQPPQPVLSYLQKYFSSYQVCTYAKQGKPLPAPSSQPGAKSKDHSQNEAETIPKELIARLQEQYKCKIDKVITSAKSTGQKCVSQSAIQQWVASTRNNHLQQAKLIKESVNKCAFTWQHEYVESILRYPAFEYVFIKAQQTQEFLGIVETSLQPQSTQFTVQYEIFNHLENSLVVVKYARSIQISDKGMWIGKEEKDIKQQHVFVPGLNTKLIEFYGREGAKTIVDFGCGLCEYAINLRDQGFQTQGYDGNPYTSELTKGFAKSIDLGEPFDLGKQFDWVESFEVGEHIPPHKTEIFVKNIATHARKGIVISWAVIGQGGFGHINMKSNSQVVAYFSQYNFQLDRKAAQEFRAMPNMLWFKGSLMVFRKSALPPGPATPSKPSEPSKIAQPIKPREIPKPLHIFPADTNLVINRTHNAQEFYSFTHYLVHNQIKSVTTINCEEPCQEIELDKFKNVKIEQVGNSVQKVDWVHLKKGAKFVDELKKEKVTKALQSAQFGVSVAQIDVGQNLSKDKTQLIEALKDYNLTYDETKSLSLRKTHKVFIWVFIKGINPNKATQDNQTLTSNFLAIQVVFKLTQNIIFLREWLHYHVKLGIDKFFLYDNSNSEEVSLNFSKVNLNFQCVNRTEAEVQDLWRSVWAEFYDHIVYVRWEPRNNEGKIIYGQVEAQRDYLHYYKYIAQYTSFTDIDQFVFSPSDLDLKSFLLEKAKLNVYALKLFSRHFVFRYCQPMKRVTQIYDYFPERIQKWSPKIITQTQSFIPRLSIHEGTNSKSVPLIIDLQSLRLNHYSFERQAYNFGVTYNYLVRGSKFEVDKSMEKWQEYLEGKCKGKCSETYSMHCPQGKEFTKCLDLQTTRA